MKEKEMYYAECSNCRNTIPIHHYNRCCPHCNAVLTTRLELEEPFPVTDLSSTEIQAVATTERMVRIVTDTPTSVLLQRIGYLRSLDENKPEDILIITRDANTAQHFRQRLYGILPMPRIDFMVHHCMEAVQKILKAAGYPPCNMITSESAGTICNAVMNQICPQATEGERQRLLDFVLAAKQSEDYASLILSGSLGNLPERNLEESCLKRYLQYQHQNRLFDYDDILMILWNACSPVPVKYLFVEDAASYSYRELLLIRRIGRNITFLQYPYQEVIGHDPEQFSEIFPNCTELTFTTTQFQR